MDGRLLGFCLGARFCSPLSVVGIVLRQTWWSSYIRVLERRTSGWLWTISGGGDPGAGLPHRLPQVSGRIHGLPA
jgi:hypothetical protein